MQVDASKLSSESNCPLTTQILDVEEKLFFLQNVIPQKGSRRPSCQQLTFRICSEQSRLLFLLQGLVAWAVVGQPLAAVGGWHGCICRLLPWPSVVLVSELPQIPVCL